MDTDPTHGTFNDILIGATPELLQVCDSLRAVITSLHRGAVEVVWPSHKIASFGVRPKKITENYAYIAIAGAHVNRGFYHGTSLPDPTGLLERTGKKLRHVKIRDMFASKNPAIAALLREAIADRKRCCAEA